MNFQQKIADRAWGPMSIQEITRLETCIAILEIIGSHKIDVSCVDGDEPPERIVGEWVAARIIDLENERDALKRECDRYGWISPSEAGRLNNEILNLQSRTEGQTGDLRRLEEKIEMLMTSLQLVVDYHEKQHPYELGRPVAIQQARITLATAKKEK